MGGPRNNLTWHPAKVRHRVYALHYEGYSAAQINADPAVAASVAKTGYRLHNNTLAAAWRSAEYKRYAAGRDKTFAAVEGEQIAQRVLEDVGALSSVTDVARYELAREIRELIGAAPDEGESAVERVERLTRSLATVTRDETARLKAENAELKTQIAELELQLHEAGESRKIASGLSDDAIRQIEEQAGLL